MKVLVWHRVRADESPTATDTEVERRDFKLIVQRVSWWIGCVLCCLALVGILYKGWHFSPLLLGKYILQWSVLYPILLALGFLSWIISLKMWTSRRRFEGYDADDYSPATSVVVVLGILMSIFSSPFWIYSISGYEVIGEQGPGGCRIVLERDLFGSDPNYQQGHIFISNGDSSQLRRTSELWRPTAVDVEGWTVEWRGPHVKSISFRSQDRAVNILADGSDIVCR